MFKALTILVVTLCMTVVLGYAHGNATHLTGTITAIEGDHIQIKDQAGKPVIVMLQKTTKFIKSEKAATKADLKVGTRILIDAKMDDKMKMYAAEEVHIGVTQPAKAAAPTKGK